MREYNIGDNITAQHFLTSLFAKVALSKVCVEVFSENTLKIETENHVCPKKKLEKFACSSLCVATSGNSG